MKKSYLNHKTNSKKKDGDFNEQKEESKRYKDEEMIPLRQLNDHINNLNGIKGICMKEAYLFSNMFTWQSHNVFEIYEADSQGKQLIQNSKPIMYAVANIPNCCGCDLQHLCTLEIAITTQIDKSESSTPFILLKERNSCCSFNSCEVYINDKGNERLIGYITQSYYKQLTITSDYLNDLIIQYPICTLEFNQITYKLFDEDGNQGVAILQKNFCDFSNPYIYHIGFPSDYNEDQNTLLISLIVYLGYLNFTNNAKEESRK